MAKRNAIYAQSGGVTAVINATASGLIEAAHSHRDQIGKVLAGRNGIIGVLREELIDTSKETPSYDPTTSRDARRRVWLVSLQTNQSDAG